MRKIHGTRLALLSALLAVSVGPSRGEDALSAGLLACAKLADNLERLSCYDRLTNQMHTGSAHPPGPASAGAPGRAEAISAAGPPSAAATSAAAADMFGATPAETAKPPSGVVRTELKSITAHVTSLRETQRSGAVLDLDNGQKWQQLGTEDLMLKVGDRVTISRGAFSSFWLMTPGNRATHVKRLL